MGEMYRYLTEPFGALGHSKVKPSRALLAGEGRRFGACVRVDALRFPTTNPSSLSSSTHSEMTVDAVGNVVKGCTNIGTVRVRVHGALETRIGTTEIDVHSEIVSECVADTLAVRFPSLSEQFSAKDGVGCSSVLETGHPRN